MPKTYSEILDDCETILQDAGVDPSPPSANSVFATAELDSLMPSALARISFFKPWQKKTTKSTVADTRDITLTTGDKWRLLGIEKLEYLTAKNPPVYRNYNRFGDVVSIKIDTAPTSADDIYFSWNKVHLLQKALGTTDTTGAVETEGTAGDITLALKGLGTGTINEMTTFLIAGDATIYYVIAEATITANEATVSIWPPLAATASVDAVVTLSLYAPTGAIDTDADAGAVSLALKGLGAGNINEMSTLVITGDTTIYYVIAQASITSNEATVSIWPPLTAAADEDAVVTISVTGSTLDMSLEAYLARWLAAKACISKATKSYAQVNTAITTIANAATAIAAIAALTDLATKAATGDIALGRAQTVLGATAVGDIAAIIDKAEAASTGDIALGRAEIVKALTAITTAETELAKIDEEVALAIAALSSGNSLINTIPVGGGAPEYMGQAASDIGTAQGRMMNGQAYLQKASATLNNAANDFRAGSLELETSGAKAREGMANFSNAASHFNAATADFRAASEKANEAVANLRLVATRLQVSQGGLNYERWGRTELAQVEVELRSYGGYPTSQRYPRD